MAPIIKIGSPTIKSICHSNFSNIVEIIKARTGITTPTYPARPGPTFSSNFKYEMKAKIDPKIDKYNKDVK